MTLIKKFTQKLALGLACTLMGAAAHATPFAVTIAFYGEEEPPLANVRLALDLVNANGLSDSSVRIWNSLPVSGYVGGVTTVGGNAYRMDDSTGSASLQFATYNRGIHFRIDWTGLSTYAADAQADDQLTLRLFDDQGRSFLPTSDTSGNNFLAIFTSHGMENFSTTFLEIDAQIPGGPGPFPGPVNISEPGSLGMVALGMSTLALFARRRRSPR